VPPQSVSRVGVWDRLHLVRFALELRQVRPASETRSPLTASVCKQDEIALRTRPAQTIPLLRRRSLMPKVNLSGMTVEALMDLREQIDETLLERRAEIEKQLQRMGAVAGGARVVRGRRSALKGKKVPPKYRSPSGETWAGRGAKPRWLVAAIKGGKKLDDFLIDKSARKGRKKRRSKR
jgi:DNA-binding protein H-NS